LPIGKALLLMHFCNFLTYMEAKHQAHFCKPIKNWYDHMA
jgi:hypothetical protein